MNTHWFKPAVRRTVLSRNGRIDSLVLAGSDQPVTLPLRTLAGYERDL